MSQNRIWAIVIVAILHALMGYAFVTGLAYKFVKNVQEDLKTFDVEEPPPPEEEPPPPPKQEMPPPPVTAPPAIIQPVIQQQIIIPQEPQITQPREPEPTTKTCPDGSVIPVSQNCPEQRRTVEPARARANLGSYVSDADYPSSAIRNEESGTTGFRLTIGTDGRVTNCQVTRSSGSTALDNSTCNIMRRRARFTPARDQYGQPTTDSHTASITWRLQDQ